MKRQNDSHPSGRDKRVVRLSDDLLWGIHPVSEAVSKEPDRIVELIIQKDKRGSKWEEIIKTARESRLKLSFVTTLKVAGDDNVPIRHQGIVARVSSTPLLPFEKLLQKFEEKVKEGEMPRLMVCDTIQDPHNLGAIVRSAHASGMTGVVVTREKSAPLGGVAAKSSAGAMSHIDICQVTNLATALQQLKKAGAWVFGAVKESEAQSLYQTDLCLPACIVVGSEGKGIRPLVRKQCDILVSIPMVGQLDSLNSSVAAGVIMFEALRQHLAAVDV
ncbi:MAG: 23S rRNA (guanosine(2251)-2'-O)-methyltransferase RlmB [Desulfopila sp.]|jgi:23S rRNA (guanosine2251-2'-O)-methyltransferase|nr:23S rRNA (guanosine(2251)-2'-O)-methyltransferase RlmB [Desulfopila sp.]